ncbi:MAG: adenosine deaminase [Actinomycetota bacterium]
MSAGSERLADRLVQLPKAELHMHLESSMRASTAAELAERDGRVRPRSGPFRNLSEFVVEYEVARDLVGSLDDLNRVARELVEDAATQGVVWSEVHLVPPTYAGRLGPDEAVVEAVLDGLGATAGVVLGVNRGLPMEAAERSLDLALEYAGRGVVGLGLAGDEAHHPPGRFAALFARAREAGLLALPHGGEGAGPESVRSCVEELGAARVCHGVRAVEDPAVVELVVERGVALDVCPSSNVSLQVAPSLAEHPLPRLLDAGAKVTLNSDGPLFSGATVNDEYRLAAEVHGLDDASLARIARTSIEVSSCPSPRRKEALEGVAAWVARPRLELSAPAPRRAARRSEPEPP